jgi:hypothetical protein
VNVRETSFNALSNCSSPSMYKKLAPDRLTNVPERVDPFGGSVR